ncbi:MAG: HD domain-containing protein [Candidatus Scalindua sp.]|nr:HD domain-containing protein [Candidatus Scalindua sp.]
MSQITTPAEALKLLSNLGAPPRLIAHLKLVGEAAEELIDLLKKLNLNLDYQFIKIGTALHDAGKTVHQSELSEKGNLHEPEGEKLLLENNIPPSLARVCQSHARYNEMECTLEELVIALSDKLWKGERVESLEQIIIEKIANKSGADKWDIYIKLDSCFENIARKGDDRLRRQLES